MARTRAQRRRHTLFLSIAIAVTLVVLVFARDVSRSAHGAVTTQRSENRSFAGLANALITQENTFDARFATFLGSGATLSRPVFDARLKQFDQQLSGWSTAVALLRRPTLTNDINDKMANITEARVDDYEQLVATIARALTLPVPSPGLDGASIPNPAQALVASTKTWNNERFALRQQPGAVRLYALVDASATYFASSGLSNLSASASLVVVRGIGVAAVAVTPAPLPAPHGELLLPPVTTIHLGVSVINTGFVVQEVTLNVAMTPSNGPIPAHHQTFHVILAPLQSFAFTPQDLATVPSERATLQISISGAPASPNMTRSKSYRVELSPSAPV